MVWKVAKKRSKELNQYEDIPEAHEKELQDRPLGLRVKVIHLLPE